ncbi:MAG: hypothetical protein ACLVB5_07520 [Christensenellales bacterium]
MTASFASQKGAEHENGKRPHIIAGRDEHAIDCLWRGREDARGAAGRRARGLETLHIEDAADVPDEMPPAQAVMLPWPRSFREERLISAKGGLERERVLALIPACRAVLAGGDVKEEELAQTALVVRPEKDETFLRRTRG